MRWPTDQEAIEALHANASKKRSFWFFADSHVARPLEEALGIVKACLYLDVPVNDTILGRAWGELVRRVAALEERNA